MGVDVLIAGDVGHDVPSSNELYAKQREWQISCNGNMLVVGPSKPTAVPCECVCLEATLGMEDLCLSFCRFPHVSIFSNSFGKEIDQDSLTEEVQLMVIEAPAREILIKAESFLRYNIKLSKIRKKPHPFDEKNDICMCLKTQDGSFATDFYISGTSGMMSFIRKKLPKPVKKSTGSIRYPLSTRLNWEEHT
jgi:hypothetical protein